MVVGFYHSCFERWSSIHTYYTWDFVIKKKVGWLDGWMDGWHRHPRMCSQESIHTHVTPFPSLLESLPSTFPFPSSPRDICTPPIPSNPLKYVRTLPSHAFPSKKNNKQTNTQKRKPSRPIFLSPPCATRATCDQSRVLARPEWLAS